MRMRQRRFDYCNQTPRHGLKDLFIWGVLSIKWLQIRKYHYSKSHMCLRSTSQKICRPSTLVARMHQMLFGCVLSLQTRGQQECAK